MQLTRKLLGFLNRVFRKDGKPVLAFRLTYSGNGMTWQVRDQVLTTTVTGGQGGNLSIDLTQYTMAGLVAFLGNQTGYTVLNANPLPFVGLGAVALLDASGDIATSNGDHLYGFTSLTYALLDAAAVELDLARRAIAAMPAEMSTTTADGYWLDVIGSYYAVPRNTGESDGVYSLRIPATVLQPKGNNKAIELAILKATGQVATVTDVVGNLSATEVYNGAFTFNGSKNYAGTSTALFYGLFDVVVNYDLVGQTDLPGFTAQVTALVNVLRDAGTQLRNITVSNGTFSETMAVPIDTATVTLMEGHIYDASFTYNGQVLYAAPAPVVDVLAG